MSLADVIVPDLCDPDRVRDLRQTSDGDERRRSKLMLMVSVGVAGVLLASCGPNSSEPTDVSAATVPVIGAGATDLSSPASTVAVTDGSVPDADDGELVDPGEAVAPVLIPEPPVPDSLYDANAPVGLVPVVIETVAHDRQSSTQGLLIEEGRMFESAGRYGASTLREVDPATGEVLRVVENNPEIFAEGLELVGDRLIQLTWLEELAYVWDADTFELLDIHTYAGEGWGLCTDGVRLVMSDGTDELTFRDPETFVETGSVNVTLDGSAIDRLNELECVDEWVFANVWKDDVILVIELSTGVVHGVVDASDLVAEAKATFQGAGVLNGIAYDESAGVFHVTGKNWPSTFVVQFVEA